MRDKMIIAVDFDGTCVEHEYPHIGLDVEGAVETLKELQSRGHRIILYTMRSGSKLDAAVRWFKERKIELWAVNENPEQREWTESVKVYADYYIDDAALAAHAFAERGVYENQVIDAVFLAALVIESPFLAAGIFGGKAAE